MVCIKKYDDEGTLAKKAVKRIRKGKREACEE